MNIIAKQAGQAMVANFDSQYRHCEASEETAAPQFGQLRVCASIFVAPGADAPSISLAFQPQTVNGKMLD
ncbi:MAG TPA: hypothetical protein VJT71_11425 [Pyrinomonadaceae bacterium]|nr:hypothetical protein [Pyrinomonadaceae bacterium]